MCLVMEFVGGGDMKQKIKNYRKRKILMSENKIWSFLVQIIAGLKALHEMKIIHRDIKSANLFLTDSHKKVKLGDLNVAKIAKNDFASTQIGTPYYLAPEIWKNEIYDYKCDIFSLGCVIYEMISLLVPFQGDSLQDLFLKINKGTVRRINKRYSQDLWDMILLLLTNDPKKRPSSFELAQHPLLIPKYKKYGVSTIINKIKDKDQILLNTILIPKNLKKLETRLPKKKKYHQEELKE